MGNSQTKEARGQQDNQSSNDSGLRNDANTPANGSSRPTQRASNARRGSRPDFSSLLGLGNSNDPEPSEVRRENKVEREARRQERERAARLKERERSMREEHVDGGYLVTQGVYVGVEDYSKPLVRQLQIERRLAPFWRGLNDFSDSWAEHQLMAAARGMAIPPPDEVPPELEYTPVKASTSNGNPDRSFQNLTTSATGRAESFQSDSAKASPVNSAFPPIAASPPAATPSSPLFRARAKTLASLGSASRNASEKDLSPRELKLTHDPFVNGQPIEVFLYKDASECPICFLYYPPYLNTTRCCEQSICSECFVQIKRPDPHPPEHNDPDPNAPPVSAEERQAQGDGLLVSEVATCPYCKQPEFGITYVPPPFRRGLTYAAGSHPYQIMSARSSQNSVASGAQSPTPGRRRGTSLSASNPEVITTDKVRPDWANKLATARAHAARRSAAASALHAAAYLMNDQSQRPGVGPFARRNVLRRSTLGGTEQPSEAQLSAMSFLAERHAAAAERNGNGVSIIAPPRGSSSRRSRMDDLEEMMMMEAIRLSLAAEEDRRKKEEKEARKKAKKEEKEQKKAEKAARKHGQSNSMSAEASIPMQRTESNISSIGATDDISKGKGVEYRDDSPDSQPLLDGDSSSFMGAKLSSSLPGTSQESLSMPVNVGAVANPFKRSHLRQMSNASSASSSFQEPTSNTPPLNEPMFNFRSLAAIIGEGEGEDEKADRSQHLEDADNSNVENGDVYDLSTHENPGNGTASGPARSKRQGSTAIDEFTETQINDAHV